MYITEDYYRMYDIANEVWRIYNFVYIDTKNNYVTPQFMGGGNLLQCIFTILHHFKRNEFDMHHLGRLQNTFHSV